MITYDLSQYEYPMEEIFDGEDFEEAEPLVMEEQHRWHTSCTQVFRHKGTGEYWMANWNVPNTEYQEYDHDLVLIKVEPYQVTVTQYRVV